MLVGEVKKYLADFKDEQEFIIEMVPNFKMSVKAEAVEAMASSDTPDVVGEEVKPE